MSTRAGFTEAYYAYAADMFNICYNRLKNRDVAMEIVQNIFLRLWDRRDQLSIQGSLKRYLFRATKLEMINHYRQQVKKQKHIDNLKGVTPIITLSTQNELDYEELKSRVNEIAEELPTQCAKVFKLSRLSGLSIKEIASQLELSEKTVEAHLTKALKFVRSQLSDYQCILIFIYFFSK
ncbi:MAG: RNA polymerase sigma-70 factor [Bacteroidota bacterium]